MIIKYDDLFEDVSIRIKKDGIYFPNNDISNKQIDKILKDSKLIENLLNSVKKEKELLKPATKEEKGGKDGEVQAVSQINFIPDYYDLLQKFSMNVNDKKRINVIKYFIIKISYYFNKW